MKQPRVQIRKMVGYDLDELQDAVGTFIKSCRNPKLQIGRASCRERV